MDLLIPVGNSWRLIEVKASTSVKDQYIPDCAIQAAVLEGAGVPVSSVELAHVNNQFVYPGNGDYRGLLTYVDLTKEIVLPKKDVPGWAADFRKMLDGDKPSVGVGAHCSDPYDCPYWDHCAPPGPDYPVSILPRGGKLVDELVAEGYEDLRDVPEERLSRPVHQRVHQATVTGQPYFDRDAAAELSELQYPRYYLDFETVAPAVPIWAGTRPYQQVPFQWSCHIETRPGIFQHQEFLATGSDSPCRPFAEGLIKALGDQGPVFVYSHYEKRIINELISMFPDLTAVLNAVIARLYDLLPLARDCWYHPGHERLLVDQGSPADRGAGTGLFDLGRSARWPGCGRGLF